MQNLYFHQYKNLVEEILDYYQGKIEEGGFVVTGDDEESLCGTINKYGIITRTTVGKELLKTVNTLPLIAEETIDFIRVTDGQGDSYKLCKLTSICDRDKDKEKQYNDAVLNILDEIKKDETSDAYIKIVYYDDRILDKLYDKVNSNRLLLMGVPCIRSMVAWLDYAGAEMSLYGQVYKDDY